VKAIHQIAPQRFRLIKEGKDAGGPVIYWMTREQRVADNWALLLAQNIAVEHKRPIVVVFCFVPDYPGANIRHYGFMLKGLQEVEQKLQKLKIPFVLLRGTPPEVLPGYLAKTKGSFLVTDFDPLHCYRTFCEIFLQCCHTQLAPIKFSQLLLTGIKYIVMLRNTPFRRWIG
jgi:hypothetical protein